MKRNKPTPVLDNNPPPEESEKLSFDEVYKAIVYILGHGTKEEQDKVWKLLNEGKGEWVWMRVKIMVDAYEGSDTKGREQFSLIAIEGHIKSGFAVMMDEAFTDTDTGIRYRQYKLKDGRIWRIPYATEGMDKLTYHCALNKKFLGDNIELHSADSGVKLIPLDTQEKVDFYNKGGTWYENHPLFKK